MRLNREFSLKTSHVPVGTVALPGRGDEVRNPPDPPPTAFYPRPMSQDSAEIVRNAWKLFASRSGERIAAVFTDDAEWLAPAGNATAVALEAPNHMVGRAAITRFLAEDFGRLFVRDVHVAFHGIYAEGDRVIVEETMTATLAGGNQYTNDYCFVFELRDGLIHRVREYMDTARGHRMIFGESVTVAH